MKENNPYRSPQQESGYFTDDVTALSIGRLWQTARGLGVIGILIVFPLLLFRKLFRLPFPASHAVCRIANLSAIRVAEVPSELRESFAPFEEACRLAGMAPVIHARPPWIGGKSGFYSVWLDSSGKLHASIAAIHIRLGQTERSTTSFSCHSRLKSGRDLHTAPVAPQDWIPEMVPPDCEPLILDAATPPAEVIARHRARLSSGAEAMSFNQVTLEDEIVRGTHVLFDFLVAKGFYIPVSMADVERLRK